MTKEQTNCQKTTDILSLPLPQLQQEILSLGEPAFRAKQIFRWMHVNLADGFEEMTNLPASLRQKLSENFTYYTVTKVKTEISAQDGSRKYLFRLHDGNLIESVLMRYHHGNSVCVSSQVGCAMGCRFCASTIDGMIRNLYTSEILSQVYQIQKDIGERISHIVIMGMGEPLLNYDHVLAFIRMISDENTLHISQRNITMSTCGIVPAILNLCQESEPLKSTLAISLHAPSDEVRKMIMPIAQKYSITQILEAADTYFQTTGRRITYEYCLISGVNDGKEHARQLAALLYPRRAHSHVNLIPVNPVRGSGFDPSKEQTIDVFMQVLEKSGIPVTRRREIGRDISGACGQLVRRTV